MLFVDDELVLFTVEAEDNQHAADVVATYSRKLVSFQDKARPVAFLPLLAALLRIRCILKYRVIIYQFLCSPRDELEQVFLPVESDDA